MRGSRSQRDLEKTCHSHEATFPDKRKTDTERHYKSLSQFRPIKYRSAVNLIYTLSCVQVNHLDAKFVSKSEAKKRDGTRLDRIDVTSCYTLICVKAGKHTTTQPFNGQGQHLQGRYSMTDGEEHWG